MIPVAPDVTIIDALRGHGVVIPTACLQGVCGRCATPVLEGQVEHRDAVLTPEQQACQMCACVSRTQGDRLVLGV
jgi:vanillate O-demethylase ferredoxin subunit